MRKYFCVIVLLFLLGCGSEFMVTGKIYYQREEYNKAIEEFKKELQCNPHAVDAMWWLAYSCQRHGHRVLPKTWTSLTRLIKFRTWTSCTDKTKDIVQLEKFCYNLAL